MNVLALMVGPYRQGISVSFELIEMESEQPLAEGHITRLGQAEAAFFYQAQGESTTTSVHAPNPDAALRLLIQRLTDPEDGVVSAIEDIQAVGHRVAHGGERFVDPCYLNARVIQDIRDRIPLAPLHNPFNLMGIESAMRLLPNVPHVAVFSTSFHQAMPDYAFIYGIPYEYYVKYGIRRYGFQGISHQYVCQRAAELLQRPLKELRLISCHLGNGASLAAVKYGRCVDTSMGFTPLEGVVMSTRAGDLDAAIVPFLMEREALMVKEVDALLNKSSGLLGISGISGSMTELLREMDEGSYRARLAVVTFCYRVKKYISSYFGVLGGADAVIFTAGIGENSPVVRARSLEGLECLGFELDRERNLLPGQERDIATEASGRRILVIPTNEELMLARQVMEVLDQGKADLDRF